MFGHLENDALILSNGPQSSAMAHLKAVTEIYLLVPFVDVAVTVVKSY